MHLTQHAVQRPSQLRCGEPLIGGTRRQRCTMNIRIAVAHRHARDGQPVAPLSYIVKDAVGMR